MWSCQYSLISVRVDEMDLVVAYFLSLFLDVNSNNIFLSNINSSNEVEWKIDTNTWSLIKSLYCNKTAQVNYSCLCTGMYIFEKQVSCLRWHDHWKIKCANVSLGQLDSLYLYHSCKNAIKSFFGVSFRFSHLSDERLCHEIYFSRV